MHVMRMEPAEMLQDIFLSKPIGFAIGFFYVASSSPPTTAGPGIPELFANYIAPLALVIYFLLRDEKRDKAAVKAETERKKAEAERERILHDETLLREERMACRINELENYINKTMLSNIAENKNSVTQLCSQIETLVLAIRRGDCPFITRGEDDEESEENEKGRD